MHVPGWLPIVENGLRLGLGDRDAGRNVVLAVAREPVIVVRHAERLLGVILVVVVVGISALLLLLFTPPVKGFGSSVLRWFWFAGGLVALVRWRWRTFLDVGVTARLCRGPVNQFVKQ